MATKLDDYINLNRRTTPLEMVRTEQVPTVREQEQQQEQAQQAQQVQPTNAEEQVSTTPDYAKLFKDKGYYGAFKELYPKQNLEDEMNRAKRQQQMALIADIANVGTQLFAASRGARQFQPVQSKVPSYEAYLQKLRDAQRGYDIDYANRSLAAAYKDYTDAEAKDWRDKQLDAQQEAAANKLAQDMMKFNANLTYKQAKDKADREISKQKAQEAARHNKAMEALSRQRNAQTEAKENKVVDSAIGSDGNVYTRNSRMTENEAKQIVMSSGLDGEDLAPFTVEERDYFGNVTKSKTDWEAAAAYALQNGMIDAEELKSRGFKLGGGTRSAVNDDNVPPSLRRNKQDDDNVPPSLRR